MHTRIHTLLYLFFSFVFFLVIILIVRTRYYNLYDDNRQLHIDDGTWFLSRGNDTSILPNRLCFPIIACAVPSTDFHTVYRRLWFCRDILCRVRFIRVARTRIILHVYQLNSLFGPGFSHLRKECPHTTLRIAASELAFSQLLAIIRKKLLLAKEGITLIN